MSSKLNAPASAPIAKSTIEAMSSQGSHISKALRELWETSKYADVKIIIDGKAEQWVHKAVICTQSGFFKRCLGINMKESKEGVVHLHEDSPDVATAMLKCLYHNGYAYPSATKRLPFDAAMYAIAVKYDIPGLQDLAFKHFKANTYDMFIKPTHPRVSVTGIEDFFAAAKIIYEGTVQDKDRKRLSAVDVVRQRAMRLEKHKWYDTGKDLAQRTAEHHDLAADVMCATTRALNTVPAIYTPTFEEIDTKSVATPADIYAKHGFVPASHTSTYEERYGELVESTAAQANAYRRFGF